METEEVRGRKKLVIIITVLPGHNLQPTMTPRPAYPANKRVRPTHTNKHFLTWPRRATSLSQVHVYELPLLPSHPPPARRGKKEIRSRERPCLPACTHWRAAWQSLTRP